MCAAQHQQIPLPWFRYQKLAKPSWTPPNYVFPLVGLAGCACACACACHHAVERLCLPEGRHALLLLLLLWPQVWIPLKILQSISLWLVWRSGKSSSELALPLGLFGLHLFLGKPASFVVAGLQYQSCCH